jgi:hypothetical protein
VAESIVVRLLARLMSLEQQRSGSELKDPKKYVVLNAALFSLLTLC